MSGLRARMGVVLAIVLTVAFLRSLQPAGSPAAPYRATLENSADRAWIVRVLDDHNAQTVFYSLPPSKPQSGHQLTLPPRGTLQVVDVETCRIISETGFDGDLVFSIDADGRIGVLADVAAMVQGDPLSPLSQVPTCPSFSTSPPSG